MEIEIKGLEAVVKKIEKFTTVPEKANEILAELCEIGKEEIEKAHHGIMGIDHVLERYDTARGIRTSTTDFPVTSDAQVSIEQNGNIHTIIVEGYEFPFFEFGAGVKRNNPRSWNTVLDTPIPVEIAPIGTYGKGHGSKETWYYKDKYTGQRVRTGGYAAVHGIANAINRIVAEVNDLVKEKLDE